MAVSDSDLAWYESAIGASDGGAVSATPVTSTKGDFWPNITDSERIAGGTRYKKSFLTNEHGSDALLGPVFWIKVTPQNMTEDIALGFDDADDDTATQGNMTAWSGTAVAALVSSESDTRAFSVYGEDGGGNAVKEDGTLNGTTEVLTTTSFAKVHAVKLASESGTATVTVKEGSGGTTRGTIGPNVECCFLWQQITSKATGMKLPDLAAGASYGFWHRQVWAPAVGAVRPNESRIAVEEV